MIDADKMARLLIIKPSFTYVELALIIFLFTSNTVAGIIFAGVGAFLMIILRQRINNKARVN